MHSRPKGPSTRGPLGHPWPQRLQQPRGIQKGVFLSGGRCKHAWRPAASEHSQVSKCFLSLFWQLPSFIHSRHVGRVPGAHLALRAEMTAPPPWNQDVLRVTWAKSFLRPGTVAASGPACGRIPGPATPPPCRIGIEAHLPGLQHAVRLSDSNPNVFLRPFPRVLGKPWPAGPLCDGRRSRSRVVP